MTESQVTMCLSILQVNHLQVSACIQTPGSQSYFKCYFKCIQTSRVIHLLIYAHWHFPQAAIFELSASSRWCLSGTPNVENFNAVNTIAHYLGLHLVHGGTWWYMVVHGGTPGTPCTRPSQIGKISDYVC